MKRSARPGRSLSPIIRYANAEPDVTETGIGKCYHGYRIFFTSKTRKMEYIGADYGTRIPTTEEAERFRWDLAKASKKDPKVAEYIRRYLELRPKSPEPKVEGPVVEQTAGQNQPGQ